MLMITAVKISPAIRNLTTPKVVILESAQIVKIKPLKGGASVLYGSSLRPYKKYRVSETSSQIGIAQIIGSGVAPSTNPYAQDATMGVQPSGSTQAAASAVSTYLTIVTGAVAASNSVLLPSASTWAASLNGGVRVIINSSSIAVSVFPAVSEFINPGASNVAVSIPRNGRLHFVPSASNKWSVATETGE